MSVKVVPFAKRVVLLTGIVTALASISGCSSVSGSATVSQVRIIDASPDAPGLDIFEGTGVIAYNLGFGTSTSYVPITPGIYNISANTDGTKQQLVTAKGTFGASHQYTVLIGNLAASLNETILQDQSQAAPSGQISLRFLDQATMVGGVDLYLVPAGSKITAVAPAVTNVTFGANTGYLNVPTGTYTLVAMPTGVAPTTTTTTATGTTTTVTNPAYFTGASVVYAGGTASTIVIVDQPLSATPAVQVITASDYAPAGAN